MKIHPNAQQTVQRAVGSFVYVAGCAIIFDLRVTHDMQNVYFETVTNVRAAPHS